MQICPKTSTHESEPSGAASFGLRSRFVWTYGESNPDFVHAMDAFYR